jgi:hypothetical protein
MVAFDTTTDLIATRIHDVLVKEYDNYKDKSFIERIILKLGKSTYIDNIRIWRDNYRNIDDIKIKLHPKMEDMAAISEKYLDPATSKRFRNLLEELTRLGFKNLQLYYNSTEEYLKNNNLTYNSINIDIINEAQCNLKYFELKKKLYSREDEVKKEIRKIMDDKRIKYKLGIYIFAFDFFNKIRTEIINKDLEKMQKKIDEKYSKNNA